MATLHGHAGHVHGLAFSPDGRRLVSASRTVKIWDTETGYEILTLAAGESLGEFEAVAFSPDGQTLAAAGTDRAVRLWRTPDPPEGAAEE